MDKTTQIVFIIFTAISSISVLVQAGAIIGIFVATRRTKRKLDALSEDFRIHVLPTISTSRALIEDLSPKIKVLTSNLVESTNSIRNITGEANGVVRDVVSRVHTDVERVDGAVQGTLDQIHQASDTIRHGFAVPLRQVNGLINGIRAGLNVLCEKGPSRRSEAYREPSPGTALQIIQPPPTISSPE
jgi:hypothetical protein